MSRPKRHHWWPQVQSRTWTNSQGLVHVTRCSGDVFTTSPLNIGVESELYTRFGEADTKDTSIEEWFSAEIDSPARDMIEFLTNSAHVRRRNYKGDPAKAKLAKEVGYRVNSYVEYLHLPKEIRTAISQYVSALLVRNPYYLDKLIRFHNENNNSVKNIKNIALENMLSIYGIYKPVIERATMIIIRRDGDSEFIYSDGGLSVTEPWRDRYGIPFDLHIPLTPDIAVQVLPTPFKDDLSIAHISTMTNQGVARMNKIAVGTAKRFVFTRQPPAIEFITKNFGIPAPENIGYRIINGKLETKYEPNRR